MTKRSQFDVFLCHNSKEKETVERIREELRARGIYAWLDRYDLDPFQRWQDQLEEIIPRVKAAAIFLGHSGVGPWADMEIRELLVEFVTRRIRMGLVILPGCPDELISEVPRFLRQFHWVDFRQKQPDPLEQLIRGITGVPNEGYYDLDNLSSEHFGANFYVTLKDLLKAGKWYEADSETYTLMGNIDNVGNFPCQDLRVIDWLWVKYSDGMYGFSVQKSLWQSFGSPRRYNADWLAFGEYIGWRLCERFRGSTYPHLDGWCNGGILGAGPQGYFPTTILRFIMASIYGRNSSGLHHLAEWRAFYSLMEKLAICNIR